jgi:hypothetical protein
MNSDDEFRLSDEYLLREVKTWCSIRKPGRFRNWDLDEFINVTWIAARKLTDEKYDAELSSLSTFLQRFMWDIVHRIYCKQQQIQIIRNRYDEDGNRLPGYAPREYKPMFPMGESDWEPIRQDCIDSSCELDSFDITKYTELTDRHHELIQMICRGMSKTQIGYAFQRSPSWVSIELRKIKDIVNRQL